MQVHGVFCILSDGLKDNIILTSAHSYLGMYCFSVWSTEQKVLLNFIAGLPPSQMHTHAKPNSSLTLLHSNDTWRKVSIDSAAFSLCILYFIWALWFKISIWLKHSWQTKSHSDIKKTMLAANQNNNFYSFALTAHLRQHALYHCCLCFSAKIHIELSQLQFGTFCLCGRKEAYERSNTGIEGLKKEPTHCKNLNYRELFGFEILCFR